MERVGIKISYRNSEERESSLRQTGGKGRQYSRSATAAGDGEYNNGRGTPQAMASLTSLRFVCLPPLRRPSTHPSCAGLSVDFLGIRIVCLELWDFGGERRRGEEARECHVLS
jgi:hypothetical protein